jgi:hypothetical protein
MVSPINNYRAIKSAAEPPPVGRARVDEEKRSGRLTCLAAQSRA